LTGTWASGAKNVLTGSGFANPANQTFTYPSTTGVSYSFTDDGFYEISRYRFNGNGSQPTCITGVLNWVHGTYQVLANGSLIMTPFGDGFQQIQDPCAAQSNFIENYNDTELYLNWQIFLDTSTGYKLHLFQFDGTPVAPQFQISPQPNMLPTQLLRNVTAGFTTQDGFVATGSKSVLSVSSSARSWASLSVSTIIAAVAGTGALVVLAL